MKDMTEFKIIESSDFPRLGLVILGEIISGEIKKNDIIWFDHDGISQGLKISAVNFARVQGEGKIGLSFAYESDFEKKFFSYVKVAPQIAIITAQE